MRLIETFYSIQGESSYAGKPCFFVRMHDCNLRCSYCDTRYAYDGPSYEEPWESLLQQCLNSPAPVVEFTGGEPLLQQDELFNILRWLVMSGEKKVLIETNGTQSLRSFRGAPDDLIVVMDIKTPSSGMHIHENAWKDNVQYLRKVDEVKFVVGDREDFEYAVQKIKETKLDKIVNEILISPVYGQIELKELAAWILAELSFARFQVQLHKIVWPVDMRGV